MKENKFEILTEAEHVRSRPNMYIGSTSLEEVAGIFNGEFTTLKVVPGLLKIINEIIDNSVDEFVRTNGEFANRIQIDIDFLNRGLEYDRFLIRVKDNGRGIPVQLIRDSDGSEEYQPVLAWTKARAGSNFGEDRVTIGANGVGSFCTNVFSENFVGISDDGKKSVRLTCDDGISTRSVSLKESESRGVSVMFTPNLSLFDVDTISEDHITCLRDRLENLMVCYPGIVFDFNGVKLKYKNAKQVADKFGQHVVYQEDKNNLIVLTPSGVSEEFRLLSYVNGLWIKNGGSHIDYILEKIITPLREFIKKKHKIDVVPSQIKSHLTLATYSRNFSDLKFDSQTKEKLTNNRQEVDKQFSGIDFDKLAKQILNTPEIIDPIIQTLLFKKEQAERLALARSQKKIQKTRVVNHIAALSKEPLERSLFIAEGLSAIGNLISVRDPQLIGGYPLKGKVMNVRGMRPTEIVKNKEISELMSILGLKLGERPHNLNYGKIIILTDADTDGDSITCLLLNLFANWPELFTAGKVYKCETPLYLLTKGKSVEFCYTTEELNKRATKGYVIEYMKGLGSLPKEVYREVINNPRLTRIIIENEDDIQSLEMAFGADSGLRKEWLKG